MRCLILCFFLGVIPLARVWASDSIEASLQKYLLKPDQTLHELQAFAEKRIPRIPAASTQAQWELQANKLRKELLEKVVLRGEASKWARTKPTIEWLETIPTGAGYGMQKLRFEAAPNFWIPALIYWPNPLPAKAPLALNLNGHEPEGKAAENMQIRSINLARRGIVVLNPEWIGMGQFQGSTNYNHSRLNQIDLCGTSGLGIFYLSMQRALDILHEIPQADPERVVVSGLSGGGWQTIWISALDPRVKFANPVAGFSSLSTRLREFNDLGDSEQIPSDFARYADYTHLLALRAPRPTLLTYNAKDECCFLPEKTLPPLLESSLPVYELFGKTNLLSVHINQEPGTHNFDRENREVFYRHLLEQFKMAGDWHEIDCQDEIKKAEILKVAMPKAQYHFNSLAKDLSQHLPKKSEPPSQKALRSKWQSERRAELASLIELKWQDFDTETVDEPSSQGQPVKFYRMKFEKNWTVPAVRFETPGSTESTIVLHDSGRAAAHQIVKEELEKGRNVLAIDLLFFGENKIPQHGSQLALLLSSLGERPLGIQTSQLNAIGRWLRGSGSPVKICTEGPRSSFVALLASALAPGSFGEIQSNGSLRTLKELIERNIPVEEMPEMFCFGLLQKFDVLQIEALRN